MKIHVTAKPRAREASITRIDNEHFIIAVKEPPIDGRANTAIEIAIADHLHVAPSCVRIVSGHASKQKVLEIIGA